MFLPQPGIVRIHALLLRNFIAEELKRHYERILLTAEYQ